MKRNMNLIGILQNILIGTIEQYQKPEKELTKEKIPSLEKVDSKMFIDNVEKAIIIFSAILYIIGLIIVNIHLRRYNYYSIDLLNAHYILAGIYALSPIVIGWYFYSYLYVEFYIKYKSYFKKYPILFNFIKSILGIIAGVIIFGNLIFLGPSEFFSNFDIETRILIFSIIGLTLSLVSLYWFNEYRDADTYVKIFVTLSALLFIIPYIGNFSYNIYGDIPGTVGGGEFRSVRIVVNDEVKDDLIAVGLRFSEGFNVSEPIDLLVVTEKECVFIIGSEGSSLSINRDIVQAILFEKSDIILVAPQFNNANNKSEK